MKILVFNPSFIGDSILTTPLIKALKHFYPDSKIDFCVRPESAPLFKNLKFIDEVIIFDKRKTEKGVRNLFRFAKKLKEKNFDLIISCHKSLRSTLINYFANPNKSISFKESTLSFLYTKTINRDMSLHEVERNLLLLKPLLKNINFQEIKKIAGKPEVSYDDILYIKIKKFLKASFPNRKIVGIAPASVWPTKMWPAEYFSKLIEKLYKNNYIPIIFASKNEIPVVNKIKTYTSTPFINLAGKTSILELSTWIKSVDLLISNDSAPLHISVAHNKPVVAIFGPTVKELGFYPYDDKSIVVENKGLDCRPCGLHGGKKCPKKHFKCMLDISPEEVYNAFLKVING
ncbi:lipopolysaccharide heptosyltransferase II [Deferribacter autotrophicus]|uniref:lipopolysaccharide heptosyltransferase II n=1 Tax=Deferribacter autotrophicus TaxID=500465 RepID=A0A5A8F498_9BACT|nr:lipopolysaccharide heptosyltransferase II [Deferribacter autotrophicus]KAA0257370.1 lipopolysaccharide heptosyltransferase II [Deferribacter autotrophicus]